MNPEVISDIHLGLFILLGIAVAWTAFVYFGIKYKFIEVVGNNKKGQK